MEQFFIDEVVGLEAAVPEAYTHIIIYIIYSYRLKHTAESYMAKNYQKLVKNLFDIV